MHDECTGCDVTLEWALCVCVCVCVCCHVTDAVCIFRHSFREKYSSFINNWALISSGRDFSGQQHILTAALGSAHTHTLSRSLWQTLVRSFVLNHCVIWYSDVFSSREFGVLEMTRSGSEVRQGIGHNNPDPSQICGVKHSDLLLSKWTSWHL